MCVRLLDSISVAALKRDPVMQTFAYIESIMAVCNRTRFTDHRELTDAEVMVTRVSIVCIMGKGAMYTDRRTERHGRFVGNS